MFNSQLAEQREIVPPTLGRYQLLTVLGQGGMGTIHLAISRGFGEFRKLLVVKELRRDLVTNGRFVQMFLQEAKLAARLNHPNVVQTLEVGNVEDRYFLSMEFLDGQPFIEIMKRASKSSSPVPIELRLRVLCDSLAGLHYAHELRDYSGQRLEIVHRDISPQNIFVTYDGQVKVVDFGIARAVDANNTDGMFAGKFSYAAPEQFRGERIDCRADLFAAGVVLWEIIALKRFASGSPTQKSLRARLLGAEPRIREVISNVPQRLADICDRALQSDVNGRYQTADEFRQDLEGYLRDETPWADTAALQNWMQGEFEAERARMHQLIHASTADEPARSGTRRLHLSPAITSVEKPGAIADLGVLDDDEVGEAELDERNGHAEAERELDNAPGNEFPASDAAPPSTSFAPSGLVAANEAVESNLSIPRHFANRVNKRTLVVAGAATAVITAFVANYGTTQKPSAESESLTSSRLAPEAIPAQAVANDETAGKAPATTHSQSLRREARAAAEAPSKKSGSGSAPRKPTPAKLAANSLRTTKTRAIAAPAAAPARLPAIVHAPPSHHAATEAVRAGSDLRETGRFQRRKVDEENPFE